MDLQYHPPCSGYAIPWVIVSLLTDRGNAKLVKVLTVQLATMVSIDFITKVVI
jgi:hypothetical protein